MEAITFTQKTKKLELTRTAVPTVTKPDEVLIKVAFSGICGTDLHIIQNVKNSASFCYKNIYCCCINNQKLSGASCGNLSIPLRWNSELLDGIQLTCFSNMGEFPCDPTKTVTLGHEFTGTVVDVGTEVKIFKKGDRVAVDPNSHLFQFMSMLQLLPFGESTFLPGGGINNTVGIFRNGGWAEYAVVPVGQVHKVPDNITLPQDTGYTLITPDQLRKNHESDPEYLFDLVIDCSGFPPAIEYATTLLQRGGNCVFLE
ncbi:hypothetical protein NQ317_015652 [Molorchus minor]|uniref:Alcohol dehydrogenase-like N-terminal domain-containing protein n=1 Tax=Molorchus minor TaxID=1323400 RepID=A0ABQ9JM14_9CUCU|nr:hypothetical protein NQ317_015652 [Molorchus minor]